MCTTNTRGISILFLKQLKHLLLPVGGKYSLGLVVAGKPVDSALNQNQAELSILVLQLHVTMVRKLLKCTEWIFLEISKVILHGFYFHYLSVPFQVLPHSNSLLDKVVEILGQIRGQAFGLQDPKDLVASDKTHLGNTMGIPQDHT